MQEGTYIYIMTNTHHNVLYIGVTSNLPKRIIEHKNHTFKNSFTDKYNIEYLVYYEQHHTIQHAIARETEIKKWGKQKKIALVNSLNPNWNDLSEGWL